MDCGIVVREFVLQWQTLGVAAGLGAGPQVQRDPGLASEGVLRLCTLLSLVYLLPRPEPAGLLHLVIRQENPQHDLPQRQSQPACRHPPSIRRALVGTCGKGMLLVPDPYRLLRLKAAATLNSCQLYYIIKLPKVIFSIIF